MDKENWNFNYRGFPINCSAYGKNRVYGANCWITEDKGYGLSDYQITLPDNVETLEEAKKKIEMLSKQFIDSRIT